MALDGRKYRHETRPIGMTTYKWRFDVPLTKEQKKYTDSPGQVSETVSVKASFLFGVQGAIGPVFTHDDWHDSQLGNMSVKQERILAQNVARILTARHECKIMIQGDRSYRQEFDRDGKMVREIGPRMPIYDPQFAEFEDDE